MGRAPCCEKNGLKKGPWTPEEDQKLIDYIHQNGYGNWRTLPKNAGLQRCGKSCRLRWTNYLSLWWFLIENGIAILSSLVTPAQATAILDLIKEQWEDFIGEMPLKTTYPELEGHQWGIVTGCDPKNTRRSYHNGLSLPVLLGLAIMFHVPINFADSLWNPRGMSILVHSRSPTMWLLSKNSQDGSMEIFDIARNETWIVTPVDVHFGIAELLAFNFEGWLLLKYGVSRYYGPSNYYYYNVRSWETVDLPELDLGFNVFISGTFQGSPNTEEHTTVLLKLDYPETVIAIWRGEGWIVHQFDYNVQGSPPAALKLVNPRIYFECGFFLYCWTALGMQWRTPLLDRYHHIFTCWIAKSELDARLYLIHIYEGNDAQVYSIIDEGEQGRLEEVDLGGHVAYGVSHGGGKIFLPRIEHEENRIYSASTDTCLEICTQPATTRVFRQCPWEVGGADCRCQFAWFRC